MEAKEYLKEFTRGELELQISILESEAKQLSTERDEYKIKNKEANQFIKDMAEAIGMEGDILGYDGVAISIDDIEDYMNDMGWIIKQ